MIMTTEGYEDYKRRAYCKEIKCPVQLELNEQEEGSEQYEKLRSTCRTDCKHTTWEFHHWLIEKEYLIIKPV